MDTEQITAILKTPGLTVIEGVVYHDIHMYVMVIESTSKVPYSKINVELRKESGDPFPCHVRKTIPDLVMKRLMDMFKEVRVKALMNDFDEKLFPTLFSISIEARGKWKEKYTDGCVGCKWESQCFEY